MEAGKIDPQSSRLVGPGLQAVQLGRESQIYVELADALGNQVKGAAATSAGLQVNFRLQGLAMGFSLAARHTHALKLPALQRKGRIRIAC